MTRVFILSVSVATVLVLVGLGLPGEALAGDAEAGQVKYQALCADCHGETGLGDGPTGLVLAAADRPAPGDFTLGEFTIDADGDDSPGSDADLKNVIRKGALKYGGSAVMAPTPGLTDMDLDDLVAFIRSLRR